MCDYGHDSNVINSNNKKEDEDFRPRRLKILISKVRSIQQLRELLQFPFFDAIVFKTQATTKP